MARANRSYKPYHVPLVGFGYILSEDFLGKETKIITFSSDEISVINHALNEQEELWGDKQGVEDGVVDENYHLIGHLGNVDKKIEALI